MRALRVKKNENFQQKIERAKSYRLFPQRKNVKELKGHIRGKRNDCYHSTHPALLLLKLEEAKLSRKVTAGQRDLFPNLLSKETQEKAYV